MSLAPKERVLFVGLCCFDVVNICDHFPLEDSDNRASDHRIQRGGNASNNATVFSQLRTWRRNNFPDAPVPAKVEYLGTLGGDLFARDLPEPSLVDFQKLDLTKYAWIHFEGRNVEEVKKMIGYLREADPNRDITISLEIEKAKTASLRLLSEDVDFLFISKQFASLIGCKDLNQVAVIVPRVVQRPHSYNLICGWGESGAQGVQIGSSGLPSPNQPAFYSPVFTPKEGVVDTLGAGDTFVASTIFARLILQSDLADCIRFGCKVAGAKCGISGFKELDNFESYI